MTQWTAHCGCTITCDDTDGEPVEFVQRCSVHVAPAVVADVSAENRAMSLVRQAVALAENIDPADVIVTLDPVTRAATGLGPPDKGPQYSATAQKCSLADFVAQIGNARTLAAQV